MDIIKLVAEIGVARANADTLPEGAAYEAAMGVEGRLLNRLAKRPARTSAELAAKARAALLYGPDDALNAAIIRDAAQLAA